MTDIESHTVFRRIEFLGSRIDDEIVFFDQQAGKYYATGSVGADVWQLLDTPKSFQDICNHLVNTYDVSRETCEIAVRRFLMQMLAAGLVTELGETDQ